METTVSVFPTQHFLSTFLKFSFFQILVYGANIGIWSDSSDTRPLLIRVLDSYFEGNYAAIAFRRTLNITVSGNKFKFNGGCNCDWQIKFNLQNDYTEGPQHAVTFTNNIIEG